MIINQKGMRNIIIMLLITRTFVENAKLSPTKCTIVNDEMAVDDKDDHTEEDCGDDDDDDDDDNDNNNSDNDSVP